MYGEAVDDRGHWRLEAHELARIAVAANISCNADNAALLVALGLSDVMLAPEAPLPAGALRAPNSWTDIEQLYTNYTDMHAQGHFDADSPDLDRLQLLTSWIPESARTLDLGCNSGAFGEVLIAKGCEVHGVDLSEALVQTARSRGVNAIRCWAEQTPYGVGEFDAVICAELLEHALDPIRILIEARRVLTPGGLLVGSVPHADGPWGHEDIGHHPEHLWALDEVQLRKMLLEARFHRIDFCDQWHGTDRPVGLAFRAHAT